MARFCIAGVCWSLVETRAYNPARNIFAGLRDWHRELSGRATLLQNQRVSIARQHRQDALEAGLDLWDRLAIRVRRRTRFPIPCRNDYGFSLHFFQASSQPFWQRLSWLTQ